jgi:hypothetical protein
MPKRRRDAAPAAPPLPTRSWWEGLTRTQLRQRTADMEDLSVRGHVVRMSNSEIGRKMVSRPTCVSFSMLHPAILDERQRKYDARRVAAYSDVEIALVEGAADIDEVV